jgi:hypothetical protein
MTLPVLQFSVENSSAEVDYIGLASLQFAGLYRSSISVNHMNHTHVIDN